MIKVQLLGIILIIILCNNLTWCWKKRNRAKRCECGIINYRRGRFHFPLENIRRRKVRVVGGHNVVPPNKYPWMVSILKNRQHHCGGVIISEHYVMTAAHCVVKTDCFNSSTKWANCYEEPGKLLISHICIKPNCPAHNSVISVQGHGKFKPHTISYDIALLKVKNKIPCNHMTTPICLPTSPILEHSGMVGTITGWGQTENGVTKSKILKEGKMIIQDNKVCGKLSTEIKTHFCAFNFGQAICQGDSGGPFFVQMKGRNYVVGISSFGTTPDCTLVSKEFFTKVRLLVPWILHTMQSLQKG